MRTPRPAIYASTKARLRGKARYRRQVDGLTSTVAVDRRTRQIRKGRIERVAFGVTLHLPKRLPPPNRWVLTPWQVQARISKAWAQVIRLAALDSATAERYVALQVAPAAAVGWLAPPAPAIARVAVTRLVASERHFLRDRDNKAFAAKKLIDCLVKAGFLRDDDETAIDQAPLEQGVSPDGQDWTVVAITVSKEEC